MTVNTEDMEKTGIVTSASIHLCNTTDIASVDDPLADLIFRSKTFARDWATMYDALNDMSMETPGVPSGSCPDMGRHSSAEPPTPKKVTHPTHTPLLGPDCDGGRSDSYDICR